MGHAELRTDTRGFPRGRRRIGACSAQAGREGLWAEARGGRDFTPHLNQVRDDRWPRRRPAWECLRDKIRINTADPKTEHVNYTKGTMPLPLYLPSQFLEALGEQADCIRDFHLLDFILRFQDSCDPPQLPSDRFPGHEDFLTGNLSKTH